MTESDETQRPEGLSRRDALKKGLIGGAVAGVVWTAPRVDGLSLRPNYASAASFPGATATRSFTVPFSNQPQQNVDFSGTKLGVVDVGGTYIGDPRSLSVSGTFVEAAGVDGCAISDVTVDWEPDQNSADCIANTTTLFNADSWTADADNCVQGANAQPTVKITITCT